MTVVQFLAQMIHKNREFGKGLAFALFSYGVYVAQAVFKVTEK